MVRGRSKFYQLGQSLFQQNTEHPCRTAPFERHSLAVPPWNACSRAASARTAGSAEVGRAAKPSRHLVRPAGRIEHGSPDSILPPTPGDCSCSHILPSAAVPSEGAISCDLASEDGVFLARGNHLSCWRDAGSVSASQPLRLPQACSMRSAVPKRCVGFERDMRDPVAELFPCCMGTAPLLMLSHQKRSSARKTKRNTQNTEHRTRNKL